MVTMVTDSETKKNYVKYLENELNIGSKEGWQDVSNSKLQDLNLPPNWKYSTILEISLIFQKAKRSSFAC
jgi:hypothetical protein